MKTVLQEMLDSGKLKKKKISPAFRHFYEVASLRNRIISQSAKEMRGLKGMDAFEIVESDEPEKYQVGDVFMVDHKNSRLIFIGSSTYKQDSDSGRS